MTKWVAGILVLALNFYVYHFFAADEVRPDRRSFEEFPRVLGDWTCDEPQVIGKDILVELGVSDYLACNYHQVGDEGLATLYVGYHASQVRKEGGGGGENSIHPPRHCLPGSGWDIIEAGTMEARVAGLPGEQNRINRFVIAKGETRQVVYYWYHSRGRVIAEDWRKILYVFWDRASRRRTDGSLVRFTVPVTQANENADEQFFSLAAQVVPLLPDYVPE